MKKIIHGNTCRVHRDSNITYKKSPTHKNHRPSKTHHHLGKKKKTQIPLYIDQEKKKESSLVLQNGAQGRQESIS